MRKCGFSLRKSIKKNIRKYGMSILFASPFLIMFTVFTVVPVFMAIGLSFTKYDILNPPMFVGIKNYLQLFLEDDVFITALKNTIFYAVIFAPISMIANMGVAWIINDYPPFVRTVLTCVFYAPSLTGGMAAIWSLLFSGDAYGIVNRFLMNLGIISSPQQWLSNPAYMFIILMIVSVWQSLGTGFLAFVAAFRGLDISMYEAASIDGIRNRFQELWYITLPALEPQFAFTAVTSITGAFGIGALSAQLFGNPSTNYAAHTLVLHMQDYASVRMEMGVACVLAVLLFVLTVGANNLFRKFIRRVGK